MPCDLNRVNQERDVEVIDDVLESILLARPQRWSKRARLGLDGSGPSEYQPQDDNNKCLACLDNIADILLLPSLHVPWCVNCHIKNNEITKSRDEQQCPLCREPVTITAEIKSSK